MQHYQVILRHKGVRRNFRFDSYGEALRVKRFLASKYNGSGAICYIEFPPFTHRDYSGVTE